MFRQVLKNNLLKGVRQQTSLGASTLLAPQFVSARNRLFSSRSVPQFRYQKPDPNKEYLLKEKCLKHFMSDGQKKWPAICIAAEAGYPSIVKSLIDAGEDVNSVAYIGVHRVKPLQTAVLHKHVDVAKVLLEAGASLGEEPISLLLTAVRNSDEAMVTLLSDAGIDVNQGTDRHFTALDQAALLNNPSMIRCLLKLGANVHGSRQHESQVIERNSNGAVRQSPLKRAVDHNHTEAAICLLENGAAIFNDDLSLLRKAVENNNELLVRALVEQGKSDPREAIDVARYLKLESVESYLTEKIHDELSQSTGCFLR